jgi:HAD superfamily hydrolase (TIGR01490 family)
MEITFSKDNRTEKKYVAFFDLDHTIIGTNSGKALIRYAYKKGVMTRLDLLKGMYLSMLYKLDIKETVTIINSMVKWLKGVSEESLNNLSSEIFKDYILNSIYREVQPEINRHKNNGGKVVILSSAIYPICHRVAEHLEIDDVICSNLESINGVYTGFPEGSFCFGKEKTVRLNKYCNENNINPINSWYYGDAISDLSVLSSVGNPVCINPDKKLNKVASEKGWRILHWHLNNTTG